MTFRMQPIASILLPVYNGERYLSGAIESVFSQSFRDWELIVQDDCSTDRTEALVKQYSNPRIMFAHNHRHLHIAASLNAALRRAKGKYIQLLGQDDRLLPDYLAVQVRFMETHPQVGFSFCAPFVIDAGGNRLMDASRAWDEQYSNTDEVCQRYIALLLLFNYGCLPGNISTVMIRRECLDEVGGFDTSHRICLDWHLWIRLARIGGFGFVKERLVEIRNHMGQESRNPDRLRDRIVETYRCLGLLEDSLPSDLAKALWLGRKKRYAAEFMHQIIHRLLTGYVRESIDLLEIISDNDGILVPLGFWMCELPRRAMRRVMGRGSIALRAAFNPKWLREQAARCRANQ